MSKLHFIVIACIAAAFVFMGLQLIGAAKHTKALMMQVNQLSAQLAVTQADAASLESALTQSANDKQKLLDERISIERIREKSAAEQERLRNELASVNFKVQQLRVSTNEHVKDWANTVVPGDAIRLLKYAAASDNAHSNSNKARLSNPTSRTTSQLLTNNHF
ncbi:hypothetical protein [Rheinheimera sp. MMS21-TC3]|uniref:hypothetical protein n=1 Tax=Rheinheimera sp. MMS21-TC3 TaxID=3072790 RepID=UPI0028C39D2D|nr:hypothetical protein [Rheinheimera sp. MMS21-TC3]WNO60434.1 hypothetical protein RDV63_05570 [Rheinheimera sp. MMS21-TC3]